MKHDQRFGKYFLAGAVLGLLTLLIVIGMLKGNIIERRITLKPAVPTLTPTPVPPTPTPTLTPQQIAENRRKVFEAWNNQYGPCKYVPILMYHHVMEASAAKAIQATNLNVIPETFRQQIDYLLGKGYTFLRLDEMVDRIKNGTLPSKSVVLTFDDGYTDFYDYVFPILKEKGIKATLFVISQYAGGERYAGWGEIKEMSDSGRVLIGDHTLNHRSLASLNKGDEYNQIVFAKQIIESHINQPVSYFAYPYGGVNKAAEQILKENNFLGAVLTTNLHPQCLGLPYEFSRIRIGEGAMSRYGF
ncbi:hypothetical protein COS54_01115 [Candidatus Shapirobacteria bacterium CG03_land_8_20_14_0_80_39_12]|uniref:NodB homology domain-containing protein n=1 Tax=Candidatus Shapirobacteria bacterium CG03_land_8_20_14_0_80_39_12 TaxID=1974879 RepID=A0A2M7BE53_9BACT|nr:MAG: hypothetical protein COS54_01115 [Candidatus Shapirobacteria bacterium CG03_land_8_20_14_0_80_39_12]